MTANVRLTFITNAYTQDLAERGQTIVPAIDIVVVDCPPAFSEVATS